VAADGSASLMMMRSVDIPAGGVCVVTDRVPRSGDQVRVGAVPPGRRAGDVRGPRRQLSADDIQVITRRSLCAGERQHVAMADAGLGFHIGAEAEVAAVRRDPRGSHVVTLAFDGLDRITRSSILRRAMEQERGERAGGS
jgi:hypothetical protein